MTNKSESRSANENAEEKTSSSFAFSATFGSEHSQTAIDFVLKNAHFPTNTDATMDVSASKIKLTNKYNRDSALLRLPAEIKQKIWTMVITTTEPITPIQLRERSNKFIWSKNQIKIDGNEGQMKVVSAVPQLAVVQLSKVCRALYEEVALTHLFYNANHFKLPSRRLVTYLIAINVPRMKAIRSITCELEHYIKTAQLFTVLAACESLQSLELIFHYQNDLRLPKLPGYKEALIAVQGLRTLKIKACENGNHWECWEGIDIIEGVIEKLEPLLRAAMKEPRGKTSYSLETFRAAQRRAHLDVLGEGRLSEDKKPGVVASRTRQQIRDLERLADDGTIPKRLVSKYDYNGDLAWNVENVLAARKSRGVPDSVEFQVECASLTGVHRWQRSGLPLERSWEDVSSFNSWDSRLQIVQFYEIHPKAYGKRIVHDSWNLLEKNYGRQDKYLTSLTRNLAALIKREALMIQYEAENAAREAAKVKEKWKRAKRSKASNH